MALKQGNGLQGWEIAVTKKLIGEFRRRSRSLYREEFDDLLQECLMHWPEVSSVDLGSGYVEFFVDRKSVGRAKSDEPDGTAARRR
ncbi:MAG: hypothetical protein ABIG36_01820 [Pseudomonadota bacterium]